MCIAFSWKSLEREHQENLDVGGRIILREVGWGGVDLNGLARDRDQ
jgi:hypothetical protein